MTMNTRLGRDQQYFNERKAEITSREILQQPDLWEELAGLLSAQSDEITRFKQRLSGVADLRIVFTGAGSSAFVGESLQMMLAAKSGLRSEAVATTDIVSAPDSVLFDVPTLLVSFSRSGESPESMAALHIASDKIKELYNLVLVCKAGSSLAKEALALDNTLVMNMPPLSSDEGFAMTGSVSCMALGAYCFFNWQEKEEVLALMRTLANTIRNELDLMSRLTRDIASFQYDRLIYLGSGGLKGLAHEGSIKSLELTNGKVNSNYETPMGFRHGPKTAINDSTLTVHLISPLSKTGQYDRDLALEILSQKRKNRMVVLAPLDITIPERTDYSYQYEASDNGHKEIAAYITLLFFLQLLSLEKSIETGTPTDNPSTGGEVNRVVKGVHIYG